MSKKHEHDCKSIPMVITKSPYFLYLPVMDMTNETVDNRLTDFLNEGKDWERKQQTYQAFSY